MLPLFLVLLPALLQDSAPPPPMERLRSPDPKIRADAEKELAAAGTRAVADLKRALAREGEPIEPRVDALVAKLASASWKERDEAARGLVRLGRAARTRLSTHENATDVEVAWRVKAILAEIKELEPAEAAAAAFADAAICRLLGAAGDGASAPLILEALKGAGAVPPEASLDLGLSALGALADLRATLTDEQAERAAEEGAKLLVEPRPRRAVASALRSLGRLKSASAVPALASLVDDPSNRDLHVKRAALAALAAIDRPESTRQVVLAVSGSDPYLREAARQILASSGAPVDGLDPAAGPPPAETQARLRAWWEKKHGRGWDSGNK